MVSRLLFGPAGSDRPPTASELQRMTPLGQLLTVDPTQLFHPEDVEAAVRVQEALTLGIQLTFTAVNTLAPFLWAMHWQAQRHRVRVVTRRKARGHR